MALWRSHPLPPRSYLVPPPIASTADSLFAYGGVDTANSMRTHTELWRLDLGVGGWSTLWRRVGTIPDASYGHSLVVLRGHLVLFGARSGEAASNSLQPAVEESPPTADLYVLDLDTAARNLTATAPSPPLHWQRLATAASPRIDHCVATHEASSRMFISGGAGPMGLLDDFWQLDYLAAWHRGSSAVPQERHPGWSLLNGGDMGGLRPARRRGHACALSGDGKQFLLNGGRGANGAPMLDDMWSFDLVRGSWRRLIGSPSPADMHVGPLVACGLRVALMSCEWNAHQGSNVVPTFSSTHQRWEHAHSGNPPHRRRVSRLGLVQMQGSRDRTGGMWDIVALVAPRRPARRGCTALALSLGAECSVAASMARNAATGACSAKRAGAAMTARARLRVLAERMECATRGPGHASASCVWYGARCDHRTCADECTALKACDNTTGACVCTPPWYGVACETAACPACQNGAHSDKSEGAALAHRASLAAIARCSRRAGGTCTSRKSTSAQIRCRVCALRRVAHTLRGRHHAARDIAISALQRAISAWKAIVAPSGCWPNTTATSSTRAVTRAVGSTRRSRADSRWEKIRVRRRTWALPQRDEQRRPSTSATRCWLCTEVYRETALPTVSFGSFVARRLHPVHHVHLGGLRQSTQALHPRRVHTTRWSTWRHHRDLDYSVRLFGGCSPSPSIGHGADWRRQSRPGNSSATFGCSPQATAVMHRHCTSTRSGSRSESIPPPLEESTPCRYGPRRVPDMQLRPSPRPMLQSERLHGDL